MTKISLKKLSIATQFKGAVWVVKSHPEIRVHQIGNTWLADRYIDGEYAGNVCKSTVRSIVTDKLSQILA